MSDFTRMASADFLWMVDEAGEDIIYTPQGQNLPHTFKAIIDRNAAEQPSYGHVGGLSTRHHEFTFARAMLPGITPAKGDTIEIVDVSQQFDADEYRVEHVADDDEDAWTVIAR